MRFRIRRNRGIHQLAYRDGHQPLRLPRDEDEWNIVRPSSPVPPAGPAADVSALASNHGADLPLPMTVPAPAPTPVANGLRAQATVGDARAERLIREVRMELADLKHSFAGRYEDRDDLVTVDLDAVRANPEAAAALPSATLVRALLQAERRIAELERAVATHEREDAALREQLARLQDDHAYARGRLETLHEVIGALHGNLDDLRGDRRRLLDAPTAPPALRPGARDEYGMRDQRGGTTP